MAGALGILECKEGQSSETYKPAQHRIPHLVTYPPVQPIPFAHKGPMSARTEAN